MHCIITDMRHSTQRNSEKSDIVCIGYNSQKVLDHILVCQDNYHCSKRHEMFDTDRIYEIVDGQT